MIARIWHGTTRAQDADEMLAYYRETGLKAFSGTEGHRGALMLCRAAGDKTEFLLVSLWESIEAIKKFAGQDYERARYFPEDERLLLELEPTVAHWQVADDGLK